jgi:hypothetical protein
MSAFLLILFCGRNPGCSSFGADHQFSPTIRTATMKFPLAIFAIGAFIAAYPGV